MNKPETEAKPKVFFDFTELMKEEDAWLQAAQRRRNGSGQESAAGIEVAGQGPGGEPWVCATNRDWFGVALSGGGIRSATFNLGLLQGLDRKGVLEHADYVSTVSGGGYVGGFWNAWRHDQVRDGAIEGRVFPRHEQKANGSASSPPDIREAREFRHLREFSRFLMPRVGFDQAETWAGVIAILGGVVPALLTTFGLLALVMYGWFCWSFWLAGGDVLMTALNLGGVALLCNLWGEWQWRVSGKGGSGAGDNLRFTAWTVLAVALIMTAWFGWRVLDGILPEGTHDVLRIEQWRAEVEASWQDDEAATYPEYLPFQWGLFGPSVAMGAAGLVLLLLRTLVSRWVSAQKDITAGWHLDMAAARCVGMGLGFAVVAGLWEAGSWLWGRTWVISSDVKVGVVAGGPVVFGGLFVWLRNWLAEPLVETRGATLAKRVAVTLRPVIPQLLAAAAVLSFLVAVSALVQRFGLGEHLWPGLALAGAAVVMALACFDPARVGMHDFYRSRICRCFLGAAKAGRSEGKPPTMEQPGDDVTLGQLRESQERRRAVHLVCCAANNLAGDTMGSLYRGARSAVLSPSGITLGNHTARLDSMRLSSALTASAAAFNSQMGRISMKLGPAVAFLMTACNLRLGLWVPHPLNPRRERSILPGVNFFREMFGRTQCDPLPGPLNLRLESVGKDVSRLASCDQVFLRTLDLHLSDGNHFENLGLYELVRRHCRYVIVSDCSADAEVAFDDLANTLRCIREDFGVEIELDVSPLRPDGEGRSAQHAVVGVIHYDGPAGTDKGSILYFKPAMTGDEPPDVLQYRRRNRAFPHEGTEDQFYDEAQWESYRRLGEHAAMAALRFFERDPRKARRSNFVDNLFLEVAQRWHPSPARLSEAFLGLTARCAELEAAVRDQAPAALRAEFFPEVEAAGFVVAKTDARAASEKAGEPAANAVPASGDDELRTVYFVMLIAQIMEDVWVGAELDVFWSHPLNEGWMNYFQRWASTPSFRRWWPVLRPIYSPGFRDFVKERFDIRLRDREARGEEGPGGQLTLKPLEELPQRNPGLAWTQWTLRFGTPEVQGKRGFEYLLTLATGADEKQPGPIQCGFLLYKTEGTAMCWNFQELFVPHALMGAGIVARFLDGIIGRCCKEMPAITEIVVLLDEETPAAKKTGAPDGKSAIPSRLRSDPGSRRARVQIISFYKSRGFAFHREPDGTGEVWKLRLDLKVERQKRADATVDAAGGGK